MSNIQERESNIHSSNVRLISIQEAAKYLGVSAWTVRDLLYQKGEFPYVKNSKKPTSEVATLNITST
ncbi:helix-turn-helix transcriptional regulator [Candidatus Magnetominusculus xianensis]|uniref:Helix-turn-helix domain-containing protein n=1 Tax=Candidatus Magnetominusculus xianensis TaxID=1748249 RepID=A0ABR5SJE4_9BACT|nr:helix-turn-helix domain-containing protein [Candidatus Magnetominusculus xianensis]KWT92156.1 hypothetical protein ASN18_0559 [Candidatus Magnetominusculus xianensis]MBF0404673.1 helix-turn-helix domain-containing protein [Nitrospirota bacterium]